MSSFKVCVVLFIVLCAVVHAGAQTYLTCSDSAPPLKGDQGPPGPAGPPGAKGDPATPCNCSIPSVEAESSLLVRMAVLEHIRTKASVHYDVGLDTNVVYNPSSNKISKIFDQGLQQAHMIQNTAVQQPTLSQGRQNGRRFISFNGWKTRMVANINLNDQNDLNVFIVYKITAHDHGRFLTGNALFGNDRFDKFVSFFADGRMLFLKDLDDNIIAKYPAGANAGAVGVWNVVSIQWKVGGPPQSSSVWCNGQLLRRFQSKASAEAHRSLALGDYSLTGHLPFHGLIGEFMVYKGIEMTYKNIRDHHQYFMHGWGI